MATPRDDISILAFEDEAEMTEHDEEFYGFTLEDLEAALPMTIGGDSDEEDSESEGEFGVIARGDETRMPSQMHLPYLC